MKKILISGKDVCKAFDGNGEKTQVLDRVNVDVYQEDFTIIMGASGAGKSTLLYALSGMDTITSGKVYYKEQEISSNNEKQMAALRSHEFGFVFQQTHLVSNLTLFENVAVAGYVSKTRSAKEVQERAGRLLEQMHVKGAKNRLPSQTSGGEAQRAAIARAMINNPGLIFADEPTGALNKSNTEEVFNLLCALNENGQGILMVTHDLRAAIRGTRLLYLEDGKILDELTLPAYREADVKGRETKVSTWLGSMEW
jgi:putative ABC transport system ATP-binding protein